MIAEEREPGLGLPPSTFGLDHVLPDRIRTRWIKAEKLEMTKDSFGAPEDVVSAEPSDQHLHLAADRRSSALAPRFPSPPDSERVVLPTNDGVGFHQERGCAPTGPHLRQYGPEQAERWIESRTRFFSFARFDVGRPRAGS